MRVRSVMTRCISFLSPIHTLRDAHLLMKECGFRHVPVVEDGILVGILSDRDVLLRASIDEGGETTVPKTSVADAMSKDLITCGASVAVTEVANVMIESKIDAMPVTDSEGRLIGLITSSDVLALFMGRRQNVSRRILPWEREVGGKWRGVYRLKSDSRAYPYF